MPSTIDYEFGDVVLVPFPFTDQTTAKQRPAAVVSSLAFHRTRADLIVAAITSRLRPSRTLGETTIFDWQDAGLLKPSLLKPVLATVEKSLVLRHLGRLSDRDRKATTEMLAAVLGE